jgi:two-component system sensor histidine kinase FlrB
VLRQIGQDFFTTRARGTGLGIAVVRSVAAAHGGALEMQSTPGKGTTACLWLQFPVLSDEVAMTGEAHG